MHDRRLHWLLPLAFVVLCGPLGLFLALNVPFGQVPDEVNQALKAQSLLGGELFGHRMSMPLPDGTVGPQQGVDADFVLLRIGTLLSSGKLTGERLAAAQALRWGADGFAALGPIAGYWPGFYLPAAMGLGLAKAIGASPFDALLLARIFDLVAYLGVGALSLVLARRGQALLFCTLSVPMSLHLGASLNQDGLLIAFSVLGVALLTRSEPGTAPASRPDAPRLWAAAAIGCVVLAKPPYLPLAGLLLLPFPSRRPGGAWAGRAALVVAVSIGALAWTWVTVRFVSTPVARLPAEAGPLWPGPRPALFSGTDMAGQMRVLMAKPIRFLTVPWHTLIHDGHLLREAIGVLGYLVVTLPAWLYGLWFSAVASAAAADVLWRRERAAPLPAWQAPVPLLCAVATVFGIYLSQYLSWTEVGGSHVEGPQGRYLLPLVPLVAFALPSLGRNAAVGLALRALPVVACLADLSVVPGVIIRFFDIP